jgi:N-acetylglucosaminyl-diphospho-decaprenol L-rhamnosyltransferase
MSDSTRSPEVTVIVVNYNAGHLLSSCITSLIEQTCETFDVIVVDNNSKDGSIDKLMPLKGNVRIIQMRENVGFAQANNLAARQTQANWIALLNPDAVAMPDWLEQLLTASKRYPEVTAFGSTQINAAEPLRLDGAGDVYHAFGIAWRGNMGQFVRTVPPEGEVFGPCAAAAMFRQRDFLEVGGFDESYFCYFEDVDLAFRLRLAGHRCVQVPGAEVTHLGSALSGKKSEFSDYHTTRNRIWTFIKNMPLPLLILLFPFFVATQFFCFLRTVGRGNGMVSLRALRDALIGLRPVLESRKVVQQSRKLSLAGLVRVLCWSLSKPVRKASHTWPIKQG